MNLSLLYFIKIKLFLIKMFLFFGMHLNYFFKSKIKSRGGQPKSLTEPHLGKFPNL
jgi:hypothetical protein